MNERRENRKTGRRVAPALGLTVMLAIVPVLSAEGPPEDPLFETPVQAIERVLKPVRDQVTNMEAKIERGVASTAPRDDPDAPVIRGWAAACCTINLRALHKKLPPLATAGQGLVRLYREAGDEIGEEIASEIVRDTLVLARHLEKFASAPNEGEARVMLGHVVRATINLNIDHQRLGECCNELAVPVPAPPTSPQD